MNVELFSGRAEEWDAFVRAREHWTHFHLFGWRSVLEDVLGHECPYVAVRGAAGELAAVLPLVRVRSWLFGHFLVSLPFVNYGGPLGPDLAVQSLAAYAATLAQHSRAKLLELRSRVPLPLAWPVSHRKITVVLDLPAGDPGALWQGLAAKLRSQVRRPEKEGAEVRFGADQVRPFFAVFSRHMRDLGTPALPLRFFEQVWETFRDDAWFGCVYLHGRAVAGGAGLRWGAEVEMTWAAALSEYSRMAPNMLLYWAFLERAAERGLSRFNFGRSSPGAGTHRFKRQWGGRDEQLWWYQHARKAGTTTPSPTDRAYSWGPMLWKRLPVSVATALGPRIVRFLP